MSVLSSPAARARLFDAPPVGRRITAWMAYWQRIGKGALTRVHLPEAAAHIRPEWAAVRQFELLQESGNLSVYDLDVTDAKRSMTFLMHMRAGGYRLAVVTLGTYDETSERDDLCRMDLRLQNEIAQMIHFVYLSQESEKATKTLHSLKEKDVFRLDAALPHVTEALACKRLFKPARAQREEALFLEILSRLPARHVLGEAAVGLELPELLARKQWLYLPQGEHKAAAFFEAVGANVGAPIVHHMRGHGDRRPLRAPLALAA